MNNSPKFGDAIFYGWQFIKRDPLAFFGVAVLLAISYALMIVFYFDTYANMIMVTIEMESVTDPEEQLAMFGQMFAGSGLTMLFWLLTMVATFVLLGALYRVLLRDERAGFLNIRFWTDELRMAVAGLVGWLFFIIGYLGFIILVALMTFAIMGLVSIFPVWVGVVLGVVLGLLAVGAISYLALAFGCMWPMTVAKRDIRLFDGFAVVRQYFWSMLVAHIVGYLFLVLVWFVVAGIVFGLILLVTGGDFSGWQIFSELEGMSETEIEVAFATMLADFPAIQTGVVFGLVTLLVSPLVALWYGIPAYYCDLILQQNSATLDEPHG